MAEYTYNPVQAVEPNQSVILNTTIPCNKGYVIHRNESGIVTLRGIVNNPCANFARYQVTFNGNIAATGTAEPIAIAIAIDGEPLLTSQAIVTPAAAGDYFNVTSTAIVDIVKGCCDNISVQNVPLDATGVEINVQNANLVVSRIA